jgi:hypothetical protein
MKRFINWLSDKFAPEKTDAENSLRQTDARQISKPVAKKKKPAVKKPSAPKNVQYSADIGGKKVDRGPDKNVLIRNKYVREDTGTHETLKIVDDSILESDDEFGLDPYNTGRFDRSRSWDSSRSRK